MQPKWTTKPSHFQPTRWTLILEAADADSPQALEALNELCLIYWYPIYAYIRSRGHSPSDAEDLTQSFFLRIIDKRGFASLDANRGKFRHFLLASIKNFLLNEWDKAKALKRGGGAETISLDLIAAEERYSLEPVESMSPDKLYDLAWARALLNRAKTRLQEEFAEKREAERLRLLMGFLPGEQSSMTFTEVSERLGLPEGTIKSDVHRLKIKFREILRDEVANTVHSEKEIDGELVDLVSGL
jgi:RNA polymerase sigma-70 factor (ECF subfamily)